LIKEGIVMLNEVSIEIIRKCPNNCMHCSSLSDKDCSEIFKYDDFISIINDAEKLGTKTICLSGGEPFLHPNIIEMINYLHNMGINSNIYTSGIIFDGDMNYASLNRELLNPIAGKVSKLIFNIESSNADMYDKIMGTLECFHLMRQSIKTANSLGIVTEAHFVPMRLNTDEIESMVGFCKELGLSKISFLRLVMHGRAQINEKEIALSTEELTQVKSKLKSLQKQVDIDIRIGVPLSLNDSCHKCEAAKGKLNIKYDGCVFPCEVFKNDRVSFLPNGLQPDNVYNTSLLEIYTNSSYLKYVRETSEQYACGKNSETCIGQHIINCEKGGN
jgi:MoaA/NifB/PqqE/SkfB family radical SAM enzyme